MIIVALPEKAKKIKDTSSSGSKWCYLGQDVRRRETVAALLGAQNRLYLKDRLHRIAERLREPYLDFVADLGKRQTNQLHWWASKFASKSQSQTSFFLLFCYQALIAELIEQRNATEKLIIFVEDPWLFNQTKHQPPKENLCFAGEVNLFLVKSYLLFRGITHRLLLIGWLILARLLILYYQRGSRPRVLEENKPALGIINPAEARAFKDGRYISNYMPGLFQLYQSHGIACFYLYPLYFPLATAKLAGLNKEVLWPLINDFKFPGILKRIFCYWDPLPKRETAEKIAGYHPSRLLQREKWLEFSSAGFNIHLIQFDALDSFLAKGWCKTLLYTFENQPWEKIVCSACAKNGIEAFGYQHSSISRGLLAHFMGREEERFMPLPEKLITSGSHFAQLYKTGRMPQEKILVGGAWRYARVRENLHPFTLRKGQSGVKPVILVSLCLDVVLSQSILESMIWLRRNKDIERDFEFWLKFHPGHTNPELNRFKGLASNYRVVREALPDLLSEIDIILYSTSTIGLEAFLYGKRVISYIPENMLAADPLLDIEDRKIYRWYEGEGIDPVFLRDLSATFVAQNLGTIREKYFADVNRQTWLNLVTDNK